MADLIVRSAHIKYQSTMIESWTPNYESLISPGPLLAGDATLVLKRIEQMLIETVGAKSWSCSGNGK